MKPKSAWLLAWILTLGVGIARAQTNPPATSLSATNAPEQDLHLSSDSFYFDGLTNQMVYLGHVYVTDRVKTWLNCDRLTIFLPPNGGNPTNIVAETNVVVDLVDSGGRTNHVVADRAVYVYAVVTNSPGTVVTNETVTFSGGNPMPILTASSGPDQSQVIKADPMIFWVRQRRFETPGRVEMEFKQIQKSGAATNNSPFPFSK